MLYNKIICPLTLLAVLSRTGKEGHQMCKEWHFLLGEIGCPQHWVEKCIKNSSINLCFRISVNASIVEKFSRILNFKTICNTELFGYMWKIAFGKILVKVLIGSLSYCVCDKMIDYLHSIKAEKGLTDYFSFRKKGRILKWHGELVLREAFEKGEN